MLGVRHVSRTLGQFAFCFGVSSAAVAADNATACDYFECAFLAFEQAIASKWTSPDGQLDEEAQRVGQVLLERGFTKGLAWLALPMTDLSVEERPLVGWSCMILTGGLETGEPMFAIGRAYEFSTRRILGLDHGANMSWSGLNCAALIGE